jgi:uncharacterized protein (TIGR03086 family)
MESKSLLNEGNGILNEMVAKVGADQWALTVPTTPLWTVAELVNHFSQTTLMIMNLLAGDPPADESANLDNPDPSGAWKSAYTQLHDYLTSFNDYTALIEGPGGKIPAQAFMAMILGDRLAHTWDLAGAIGADKTLPEPLVLAAYNTWAPIAAGIPRGNGLGEIVEVPDDASYQDKFLALTGRNPKA